MSEPNNQSDTKVEAADDNAAVAVAVTKEEGEEVVDNKVDDINLQSGGFFIVHTKHTCDKCFQRPIIGKRYTASARSNFDLCARCFEGYEGPDIGLTDAALGESSELFT